MQKKNNGGGIFVYRENSDENIGMRYSREKRLENAPESVRKLHDPDFTKRQGILQSLISTKGSRAVFFVTVGLTVLNLWLYLFYYTSDSGSIHGIKIKIESFIYNDELFTSIIFSESKNKDSVEPKEVTAVVSSFDKNKNQIEQIKTEGIYIGSELKLNHKFKKQNAFKLKAVIMMDKKILILSADVK